MKIDIRLWVCFLVVLIYLTGFASAGYDLFSVSIEIDPPSQTVKLDETTDYTISITLEDVGDPLGNDKASCYLDGSYFKDLDKGQTATKKVTISPPYTVTQKTYSHTITCSHRYWTTDEFTNDSASTRITYTALPMSINLKFVTCP